MKKLFLVSVSIILVGCTLTPVNKTELEDGGYSLTAHGNGFSGYEKLLAKIEKKASKICGADGYTLEGDSPVQSQTIPTYVNGSFVNVTSLNLTRIARCKS